MNTRLQTLAAYLQDKGFIYGPSPEIYGGLAGFFDYGPLGKAIKNNVEGAIKKTFLQEGLFEVECPTILPEEVWEASGHLGNFTDPLIKDTEGNIFRADNLIEEHCHAAGIDSDGLQLDSMSHAQLLAKINELEIKSPSGGDFVQEITNHNLMMQTTIGMDRIAYNRPETATTTYLPFMRYMNFFRDKLPNGVFQIGKAYRNEISPRQFMLRMREFTQAEAQLFLFKSQKETFDKFDDVKDMQLPLWPTSAQETTYTAKLTNLSDALAQGTLQNQAYAWSIALAYTLYRNMGIPAEALRLRQHTKDELAFYALDAWDVEVNLPSFGWTEMCGVHDRQDYDLKQHALHSKTNLFAMTPEGKKEVPHVLEIAFGVDRPVFALLDIYYDEKDKEEGKTTLALPYRLAPIPLAVMPLTNKLHTQAQQLYKELQQEFMCLYDKSGSVGKRYLRADTIGIPFCITYDFDTEEDHCVTIRDRDTGNQERVEKEFLVAKISELLSGKRKIA